MAAPSRYRRETAHRSAAGVWSRLDRIDAVASAVAHFQRAMMMDADQVA
jgi:hypothetical protein